jgi:hypothetical protein
MKKPINEEDAKVERARSLRVAPPVDQQRDVPTALATLMDLSDRRAVVIHLDLPWDQTRQQDD